MTNSGNTPASPSIADLFDAREEWSVGLEEEVLLIDRESGGPSTAVDTVLAAVEGDVRFKRELPPAQIEIITTPCATSGDAVAQLARARSDLVTAAGDTGFACTGVHPLVAPPGEIHRTGRHAPIAALYGQAATLQQVASLQIHIGVPGAERALAVFGGLRSRLPELAALGANAPFWGGTDSGFASVRPLLCTLLPRQGVPPSIASWKAFEGDLEWCRRAGVTSDASGWWWELRPHPVFGTLELRVLDSQISIPHASALVALVCSLCRRIARDWEDGRPLEAYPGWRLAENRWSALRWGTGGQMFDLRTGAASSTNDRLSELIDLAIDCATPAERTALGEADLLAHGGAARQRAAMASDGPAGLMEMLTSEFARGPQAPCPASRG